jgi:hypothetical protein
MSTSSPASKSASVTSCSAAEAPAVTTMRDGSTSTRQREAYQALSMARRSAGRPVAGV